MSSSDETPRKLTVRLTPHQAGSLIAAANLVLGARGSQLRGIGWDGNQLRTLRSARDRFEDAALIAFDLKRQTG